MAQILPTKPMDEKLVKLKTKLYKQLARGKFRKAANTRKALLGLECDMHKDGFHFRSEHIIK